MKISTNYAIPVLSNRFQSVQKRNEQVNNNVNFEGSKKSNKVKTYFIYVPMIVGAMGLGGCNNNRSPEDMPQAHWDMILAKDNNIEQNTNVYDYDEPISKDMDYESMKDTTDYNPIIDEFMAEDKAIVNVEKWESTDPEYANAYRIICANGYDKNNNKIRNITIYPNEPSSSCSTPTYGPEGMEKTYYYPGKTVTSYYTNDGEQKLKFTETKYNGNYSLNGIYGYNKSEIIYHEPEDNIARVVTYEKGEVEYADGIPFATDKSYHKQIRNYDTDGNISSKVNHRPNECNEIVLAEQ